MAALGIGISFDSKLWRNTISRWINIYRNIASYENLREDNFPALSVKLSELKFRSVSRVFEGEKQQFRGCSLERFVTRSTTI